jgi:hypothetical protein
MQPLTLSQFECKNVNHAYISYFYDKIPNINKLRKEGFICIHGFRDFSPSWLGGHGETAHIMVDRKQKKGDRKDPETRYPQEPTPNDTLPSSI